MGVSFTSYHDAQVGSDSFEGPQGAGRAYADGTIDYTDFDDPSQSHLTPCFTYTRAPRRAYYSPLYHQFESPPETHDGSAQSINDLIAKATSDAYLMLYQRGNLQVRENNKHTWELQCPHGCWVKTGIRSHVPLSTKGQFATLEAHWGSKACTKSTGMQENLAASQFALATIFPMWPRFDSSLGTPNSSDSSLWVFSV